jgi:hypothetical protein
LSLVNEEAAQVRSSFTKKSDLFTQCQTIEKWMGPCCEKYNALKREFLAKIRSEDFKLSSLTNRDVLLFLNLAKVPELISWFQELQLDGNGLLMLDEVGDQYFIQQNIHTKVRLKFFCALKNLRTGQFLDKKHIKECPVCKWKSQEEWNTFFREWNLLPFIDLGISPQSLTIFEQVHFNYIDALSGLNLQERFRLWTIIKDAKAAHNDFVSRP